MTPQPAPRAFPEATIRFIAARGAAGDVARSARGGVRQPRVQRAVGQEVSSGISLQGLLGFLGGLF